MNKKSNINNEIIDIITLKWYNNQTALCRILRKKRKAGNSNENASKDANAGNYSAGCIRNNHSFTQ